MRGSDASIAARRLPGPPSLRLVTSTTLPQRPPTALAPKPSAVGKAFADSTAAAAVREQPNTATDKQQRSLSESLLSTLIASFVPRIRRGDHRECSAGSTASPATLTGRPADTSPIPWKSELWR